MLDNGSPRSSPRRFTATTWSNISSGNKFRVNPRPPVAQKLHFSLHPTCEDTHTVDLSLPGISTVSIRFPSDRVKPSFVVPSLLSCLWVSVAVCRIKWVSRNSRKSFDKLVISSKRVMPFCQSHCQICFARNAFSPCCTSTFASSCNVYALIFVFSMSSLFLSQKYNKKTRWRLYYGWMLWI